MPNLCSLFLIDTVNIKDNAITTSKIADQAITTSKFAPDAIAPNSDMLDGFHASLTIGANTIIPLDTNSILDLTATFVKSNVYTFRRVDLTNATSDYELQVGEEAVYTWDTTVSLTLSLKIALVEGLYELLIQAPHQTASDITCNLYPNNTTYSNAFAFTLVSVTEGASQPGALSVTYSLFHLYHATSGGISYHLISTRTTAKFMFGIQRVSRYTGGGGIYLYGSRWKDTTTIWSSLGTLTTSAANGTIEVIVRRLK